jgi:hypothetical protein
VKGEPLVERQIQPQDVDAGFAQESEIPALNKPNGHLPHLFR